MTCTAADCKAYPHYGHSPGRSGVEVLDAPIHAVRPKTGEEVYIPAGSVVFGTSPEGTPREEWPDTFIEDPEVPGFGTYYCPTCRRGMPKCRTCNDTKHTRYWHHGREDEVVEDCPDCAKKEV